MFLLFLLSTEMSMSAAWHKADMIAEKLFRESDLGPFTIAGCTDCELFKILNKFPWKHPTFIWGTSLHSLGTCPPAALLTVWGVSVCPWCLWSASAWWQGCSAPLTMLTMSWSQLCSLRTMLIAAPVYKSQFWKTLRPPTCWICCWTWPVTE